jgi:hypothetical protein
MKDIMDISLSGTRVRAWFIIPQKARIAYNGCRALIPVFDAMAPVMNGKTALPACPNPAIQPIDPVRSQRGRTRPA